MKHNAAAFFLSAFSIPTTYIRSPRSCLDLRTADKDAVRRLREHLFHKEYNRWNPENLNRLLDGDETIVVSRDQRYKMTERSIGVVVGQAVVELKRVYFEAL